MARFQTRVLQWGRHLLCWPRGSPNLAVQGQLGCGMMPKRCVSFKQLVYEPACRPCHGMCDKRWYAAYGVSTPVVREVL